jgi:hypothetical protein
MAIRENVKTLTTEDTEEDRKKERKREHSFLL